MKSSVQSKDSITTYLQEIDRFDQNPLTLAKVGERLNVSREWMRRVEREAFLWSQKVVLQEYMAS